MDWCKRVGRRLPIPLDTLAQPAQEATRLILHREQRRANHLVGAAHVAPEVELERIELEPEQPVIHRRGNIGVPLRRGAGRTRHGLAIHQRREELVHHVLGTGADAAARDEVVAMLDDAVQLGRRDGRVVRHRLLREEELVGQHHPHAVRHPEDGGQHGLQRAVGDGRRSRASATGSAGPARRRPGRGDLPSASARPEAGSSGAGTPRGPRAAPATWASSSASSTLSAVMFICASSR